jgi:hypothetical protein
VGYKDPEYQLKYYKAHSETAKDRAKEWVKDNPDRAKATRRAWYLKNRESVIARTSAYAAAHPEYRKEVVRKWHLNRQYGMTQEQWDALFLSQGERCAICKTNLPGGRYNQWSTDHDHVTEKVRAILCAKCNTGLGSFDDDPERLRQAALYIESFK